MKIAVASIDGKVSQHFGHCDGFYLFDEENGTIHNKEFVQSPEHVPGLLPKFLADLGVNTIISGGMGGAAVNLFNERNVEVVVGATGDAMENVQEYLKGNLKSTGSICHHHEH
ncbi:MAG: NifB/NifX family molybdenum-iron cluster-binding protein [Tissierellales bacterium]|jgi:predicted Fe-Mo cluster-binding NifX family protein|nr:NifB/NifX family molybdenum-iron cluster-binding protein [Tissierellales bacterium]MBN2827528.1 NifB/NifX family molybdenum-iron cluster-binding protein [Tissierellales bacterium]